jgi:hypothetical protein
MRILTNLKGWTNGGPLVKLVKGEGHATRARALARLASPGRAVGVGVACRVETVTVTAQFLSFMSAIILCIKTTVTGN